MRLIVFTILILSLVGCKKGNKCFDRPGNITSKRIDLSDGLSKFQLYDDLNYVLINDSLDNIEITGGENLIDNISVSEQGSSLEISNENKCLFMSNNDGVDVTIHYSTLNELGLYGYGKITSLTEISHPLKIVGENCFSTVELTINNDSTVITLEGSPIVTAVGTSDYLYAYTVGKGNYYLEQLQTEDAHAHSRGLGDIHVAANRSYIIELRSRGDIYLYDTLNTSQLIFAEGEGSVYYR